jgi:hypothetical protein
MASMLIGSAVGAADAARVTAVRPRAGAGARAFSFGANHAASPSRVASLGRRGTVRVAVRASLGAETVREEKPEARVVPEDAPASASRGEALKQVQTRPFSGCHHGQKYRQPGARSRFSAKLARRLSDRPPPTPSTLPRSSDFTPRSSSVSRPSRWLSLVRPRPRRDTSRRVPARGSFFRDGSRAKILARRAFVFFPTLFALFRNNQS